MTVQVPPRNRPIIIFYSPTVAIVEGWVDFSLPAFVPEGGWFESEPHRHPSKNYADIAFAEILAAYLAEPPDSLDADRE